MLYLDDDIVVYGSMVSYVITTVTLTELHNELTNNELTINDIQSEANLIGIWQRP